MTGLRSKCSILRSDPEKDRYFEWDRIFVNQPWTWGPQQVTIREGFTKRNENPRRVKPQRRYDNYLDSDEDYDDRNYRKYPSTSVARRVLPRCAREHVSTDDSLGNLDFPRQARGEVLSKSLTDEQKMLLYPLTFGFSLKTKVWSKSSDVDVVLFNLTDNPQSNWMQVASKRLLRQETA